ncbi:MAG: ThuA domain-containing protein, partial [Victivallales bacterium]|nr:ThuA domain-containing protein [Victivallales bacterium]
MKKFMIVSLMVLALLGHAQENKPQPNEAEIARMKNASPKVATVKPAKPRNVLVFMDTKGFYHTSIPFATKALEIIGETTGAFTVKEVTDDTSAFEPEHLKDFDVIVLNNNTSRLPIGGVDVAKMPAGKERDAAEAREMRLRKGLLDFVRTEGKGILGIHAAIDAFYTWPEYGEMMGGYFNLHPWSETVGVELVDAGHPLMRGWRGVPFSINEEIYQVKEPYSRDKQRVLMRLDVKRTNMNKGNQIRRDDGDFANAWLKNYGKGRVVYIGFGHRHETFWNPGMLQMMLDSMQYCAGDLKCDERPSNELDDAYYAKSAQEGFERGLQDIIAKLAQYQYSVDDTEAKQIEYLVNDAEAPGKEARAKRLAAVLAGLLKPESSLDARNFALRQLSRIGGEAEIPAIESQFADEKTAVMALYALQRIPDAAAEQAMIRSLDTVPRERAATAIALGRKKCAAAVAPLAKLLNDETYGPATALGIGMIGTKEA